MSTECCVNCLDFSYFRADDIEIERLQIEARRSAEVEHAEQREAHDGQFIYYKKLIIENLFFLVVRFSNHLEELQAKRIELETNWELIIRRMKELHNQINNRRRESSTKLFYSNFLF
jgi:hypothetical protein